MDLLQNAGRRRRESSVVEGRSRRSRRRCRPADLGPKTWTQRQMQFGCMNRPRSIAISAMCTNEMGNPRYHRTHQRVMSPG